MPKKKKVKKVKQLDHLEPEHIRDFEALQAKCYEQHCGKYRPMVVKAQGYSESVWYICQECLDEYMEKHPELKELIVAFRR